MLQLNRSFPIQEINDKPGDWMITHTKVYGNVEPHEPRTECNRINSLLNNPDISSVKYSSDGKLLKANVYLSSPFVLDQPKYLENQSINALYKRYSMIIDTKSIFDVGADYGLERLWSPSYNDSAWYKSYFELSSNGNFTPISNTIDNYFINNSVLDIPLPDFSIPFDFELDKANHPERYNVNILFEDAYVINVNDSRIVCSRTDVSQWLPIPPPDISINLSSSTIELRPGETEDILLYIKNSADLNAQISTSASTEGHI